MIRHRFRTGNVGGLLIALAVLALLPAAAPAQSLTFINDTKVPVVVQLATGAPGRVKRDKPHQLFPGDKVKIVLAGDKLVNVYDARNPNRVLYQGTIPDSKEDLVFSIQPDPRGLPKVNLEPVKPGAMAGPGGMTAPPR
jgi:hypothetical protein